MKLNSKEAAMSVNYRFKQKEMRIRRISIVIEGERCLAIYVIGLSDVSSELCG